MAFNSVVFYLEQESIVATKSVSPLVPFVPLLVTRMEQQEAQQQTMLVVEFNEVDNASKIWQS